MDTREIDIADIDVGKRLRAVDPEKVAEFKSSYIEQGLMQPIEVRALEGGKYALVFGAHRIAAVLDAGDKKIDAIIFHGTAKEARLREIDENLYRHELTPYDQASFLAERRSLYEELNGVIKAGRKVKKNRPNVGLVPAQLSFLDETTQKFGLPKTTIKRALTRRLRFDDHAWELLRGSPFGRRAVDIDAISKLTPERQRQVVKRLTAAVHPAKSVREAIRLVIGGAGVATIPKKEPFDKMVALWGKLGTRERNLFIEHLKGLGEL
jgi:ParB family chromosome partitioning protein